MSYIKPFYIGQKIVCVVDTSDGSEWLYNDNTSAPGPTNGDVVTVIGYDKNDDVMLLEYPIGEGYDPKEFRPLKQLKFPLMKYSKVMKEQLISEN